MLIDRKLTASGCGSSMSLPEKKATGKFKTVESAFKLSSGGSASPLSYRMIVF
ncbi:hypothetical protein PAMC26577_35700 [Caballeronia sordidicola]|uniref:Uncharacterized protein n=1 Tax=Caballeronia sordidicola TaxID=196367 RepID=A0A242M948_CABSO|nr:hypothetical protein PAMC26577_35700 [Caballeronia sordidicola]